ncbi:hypothetical protein, partial [Acetobacter tropicalis]
MAAHPKKGANESLYKCAILEQSTPNESLCKCALPVSSLQSLILSKQMPEQNASMKLTTFDAITAAR